VTARRAVGLLRCGRACTSCSRVRTAERSRRSSKRPLFSKKMSCAPERTASAIEGGARKSRGAAGAWVAVVLRRGRAPAGEDRGLTALQGL